jgi:hypothetical protein
LSVCGFLLLIVEQHADRRLDVGLGHGESAPVAALAGERVPEPPDQRERHDDHRDVVDPPQGIAQDRVEVDEHPGGPQDDHHRQVHEMDELRQRRRVLRRIVLRPLLEDPLLLEATHRDRREKVDHEYDRNDDHQQTEDHIHPDNEFLRSYR